MGTTNCKGRKWGNMLLLKVKEEDNMDFGTTVVGLS